LNFVKIKTCKNSYLYKKLNKNCRYKYYNYIIVIIYFFLSKGLVFAKLDIFHKAITDFSFAI